MRRPQSNGIIERFHRTALDEHFRIKGRRTWFETIAEMQKALYAWLVTYNTKRPHLRRGMNGRTPIRAFIDGMKKSATQALEKPKGESLTNRSKQASMAPENRAA